MKNSSNIFFCILIVITSLLSSNCNKTDSPPTPKPDPLEEKVTASVNGRVIDENGKPVSNASLQAGTSTTTTDVNGVFRFNNIILSKNAGFVKIEKDGYFKSGRTIFTSAGVVNNIEIKLIPKKQRGNFASSAGGNISIESGAAINFPVNGIINKSTKMPYTGTVKVFGAYLNPEDPNLSSIMPGNLTGLTTENEQKILQTYGMIAVELEGGNGEKLNLASGKSAAITVAIPPGLQASAPATIPLWYFNDSLGIWKEEGTAARQGNTYTGSVSHFTFWNWDVPGNLVNLKLTLKNQAQELLPGYRVILKNTQNNSKVYGYTDSAGILSGPVPVSAPIEMTVYNKCNTLLLTQTVGPFNSGTDLGVVTITTPDDASIIVSGTILNCNQGPVTNGFVDLFLEGIFYRATINNGNYSIPILRCSGAPENLNMIATDIDAGKQSNTSGINVTSGNYTLNANACGVSLDQFIHFIAGPDTFYFSSPNDSITAGRTSNNQTYIGAQRNQQDTINFEWLSMYIQGDESPGTHSIAAFNSLILFRGIPSRIEYLIDNPINITITEYGGPGEYIAGNFTATMRERFKNVMVSATCNFRVRRVQ
jgi:hypothetical protein